MANLLKKRSASSNPSYEGFDLSHKVDFTSSCGHMIPIYYDLLIPGDKISISCQMLSIIPELVSPSPIVIDEVMDYYFVPLECLYSLFPALLSDTNEDVHSSLFDKSVFKDDIPLWQTLRYLEDISFINNRSATPDGTFEFDYQRRDAFRLAAALRMFGWRMPGQIPPPMPGQADTVGVNCLTLMAYQAVWQYYFRDDARQTFNPLCFNIDDMYASAGSSLYNKNRIDLFFRMRFHPWKKDPYTITRPTPLGGSASLNHFSNTPADKQFSSFVNQWLSDLGSSYDKSNNSNLTGFTDPQYVGSLSNPSTDVVFPNGTVDNANQQSLQQHRIAQAIEKLSAIWMQSGKSYQDMMTNIFGSKVHDDTSKPIYLGSDNNKIYVNELIANIETAQTKVGTMTGYGQGTNTDMLYNKDYHATKFTAPCHGIILGIYSAVPDAYYTGITMDPINLYHKRADFPWPQTDELGERPLFSFEIVNHYKALATAPNNAYLIYGWRPRFVELKLKPNVAMMGFDFGSSLSYWIPKRGVEDVDQAITFANPSDYYISPMYLNTILANSYGNINDGDGNYFEKADYFSNDPILHFFHFHSTKASKQSSYGVPSTYFG